MFIILKMYTKILTKTQYEKINIHSQIPDGVIFGSDPAFFFQCPDTEYQILTYKTDIFIIPRTFCFFFIVKPNNCLKLHNMDYHI